MSKVKFELDLGGLNDLMKSGEMQTILNTAASAIAAAAGDGYEAVPAKTINFIAIAKVRATTFKARLDNNRNKTLQKAAGSVKI